MFLNCMHVIRAIKTNLYNYRELLKTLKFQEKVTMHCVISYSPVYGYAFCAAIYTQKKKL